MSDDADKFNLEKALELAVPFGLRADGTPTPPHEADRETNYFCPVCGEDLIYRSGAVMRPHFSHHGDSPCTSAERILHQVAKTKLAQAITRWLDGAAPPPVFVRECRLCGEKNVEQKMPATVTGVGVEQTLPTGYRPDVTVTRQKDGTEQAVAALEIFVTHEVDDLKTQEIGLPWIEVTAESVIKSSDPSHHFEGRRDGLSEVTCADCEQRLAELRREIRGLLDRWNIEWPGKPYVISIQDCWKCGATFPVFKWGAEMHSTERPSAPRPKTVQHRYSKTVGSKYWANTCPNCTRIQGDYPLRAQPGGAFGPTYDEKIRLLRRAQEKNFL